jgi:hypothetical protein
MAASSFAEMPSHMLTPYFSDMYAPKYSIKTLLQALSDDGMLKRISRTQSD